MNAAQLTDRPQRTRHRSWLDRPILDWVLVSVIAFVLLRWTPIVSLFTTTNQEGQRAAMSSTASALGTIAASASPPCASTQHSTTQRPNGRVPSGEAIWPACSCERLR